MRGFVTGCWVLDAGCLFVTFARVKVFSGQLSEEKGMRTFLLATAGGGFAVAFIRRVGKPALR